jgi:hypothetical protein
MKKSQFKPPVKERETYTLPDGFEVSIQGIGLGGHLKVERLLAQMADTPGDEAVGRMAPHLLALAVVDEDGQPLMTAEQWADYANAGREFRTASYELFNKAYALSGFDIKAAEKN